MLSIQKWIWPAFAIILAVTIGLTLGQLNNKPEEFKPIIKTYQVNPGHAKMAQGALKRLFRGVESASAQSFGNGILMVRMPHSFEPGIDKMVESFNRKKMERPQQVKTEYWIVRGSRSQIGQSKGLNHITGALDAIKNRDGDQSFQLLEHLSSSASLGHGSKVKGWLGRADTYIAMNDDQSLTVGMEFRTDFGEVKTETKGENGKFLVVGQNAANKRTLARRLKDDNFDAPGTKSTNETDRIYYIFRPTLVE